MTSLVKALICSKETPVEIIESLILDSLDENSTNYNNCSMMLKHALAEGTLTEKVKKVLIESSNEHYREQLTYLEEEKFFPELENWLFYESENLSLNQTYSNWVYFFKEYQTIDDFFMFLPSDKKVLFIKKFIKLLAEFNIYIDKRKISLLKKVISYIDENEVISYVTEDNPTDPDSGFELLFYYLYEQEGKNYFNENIFTFKNEIVKDTAALYVGSDEALNFVDEDIFSPLLTHCQKLKSEGTLGKDEEYLNQVVSFFHDFFVNSDYKSKICLNMKKKFLASKINDVLSLDEEILYVKEHEKALELVEKIKSSTDEVFLRGAFFKAFSSYTYVARRERKSYDDIFISLWSNINLPADCEFKLLTSSEYYNSIEDLIDERLRVLSPEGKKSLIGKYLLSNLRITEKNLEKFNLTKSDFLKLCLEEYVKLDDFTREKILQSVRSKSNWEGLEPLLYIFPWKNVQDMKVFNSVVVMKINNSLGSNLEAWQNFQVLSESFEGTFEELLETCVNLIK